MFLLCCQADSKLKKTSWQYETVTLDKHNLFFLPYPEFNLIFITFHCFSTMFWTIKNGFKCGSAWVANRELHHLFRKKHHFSQIFNLLKLFCHFAKVRKRLWKLKTTWYIALSYMVTWCNKTKNCLMTRCQKYLLWHYLANISIVLFILIIQFFDYSHS
jgi:hypothetical protein